MIIWIIIFPISFHLTFNHHFSFWPTVFLFAWENKDLKKISGQTLLFSLAHHRIAMPYTNGCLPDHACSQNVDLGTKQLLRVPLTELFLLFRSSFSSEQSLIFVQCRIHARTEVNVKVGLTDTSADVKSASLGKHAKLVSCYVTNCL